MIDPKPIKLSGEELEKVRREINKSNMSDSTKTLLCGILQMCIWMQLKLENSKISIKRLKRLFFINSEKRGRGKGNTNKDTNSNKDHKSDGTSSNDNNEDTASHSEDDTNAETTNSLNTTSNSDQAKKGHGRLKADDYTNTQIIEIEHPDHKPGDDCPTDCGGKLYDTNRPGLFVHIEGNSLFNASRYETQALRCGLCGEYYKADKPEHINDKYDETAKSVICAQKYQMGIRYSGLPNGKTKLVFQFQSQRCGT